MASASAVVVAMTGVHDSFARWSGVDSPARKQPDKESPGRRRAASASACGRKSAGSFQNNRPCGRQSHASKIQTQDSGNVTPYASTGRADFFTVVLLPSTVPAAAHNEGTQNLYMGRETSYPSRSPDRITAHVHRQNTDCFYHRGDG